MGIGEGREWDMREDRPLGPALEDESGWEGGRGGVGGGEGVEKIVRWTSRMSFYYTLSPQHAYVHYCLALRPTGE